MIISCPACATRYNIDPKALGEKGRKVRCSNCAHHWIQASPVSEEDMDLPQGLRSALAPQRDDQNTHLGEGRRKDQGLTDDNLHASQTALPETGAQNHVAVDDYQRHTSQQEMIEEVSTAPQVQEGHYYHIEDVNAAFKEDNHQQQVSAFPIGWVIFSLVLLSAFGSLFFARDAIIKMIPVVERFLSSDETSNQHHAGPMKGLQLLQPRVQQQTVQYGTQQIEVFELIGEIVNNSDQDIKLPKLRAVVLDADQKQLDSWIFFAKKPILAPGEKTFYSTEVENTNEQDVNIIIDFVAQELK